MRALIATCVLLVMGACHDDTVRRVEVTIRERGTAPEPDANVVSMARTIVTHSPFRG